MYLLEYMFLLITSFCDFTEYIWCTDSCLCHLSGCWAGKRGGRIVRYCNPLPLATDKVKNCIWNVGVLIEWIKLNSQEIQKPWKIHFLLLVKAVDCFELFPLGWSLWYQCWYKVGVAVDTDRSLQSSWPWGARVKSRTFFANGNLIQCKMQGKNVMWQRCVFLRKSIKKCMLVVFLIIYLKTNKKKIPRSHFWIMRVFMCLFCIMWVYIYFSDFNLPFSLLNQGWNSTNSLEYEV